MQDREVIINNLINIWQEKGVVKALPSVGKSMYPLIKQGDIVNIRFIRPADIRVGDIVAFRRDNTTIVHRIIKRVKGGFIEKGDFQLKGSFIEPTQIIGRVEIPGDYLMALLGYIIYRLCYVAKPFLIIPFIINAGTRVYIKLRKG